MSFADENNPWLNIFEYIFYENFLSKKYNTVLSPVNVNEPGGIKLNFRGVKWENDEGKYSLTLSPEYKEKFQKFKNRRGVFPILCNKKVYTARVDFDSIILYEKIPEFETFKIHVRNFITKPLVYVPLEFNEYQKDKYKLLPQFISNLIEIIRKNTSATNVYEKMLRFPECMEYQNAYDRMTVIYEIILGREKAEEYLMRISLAEVLKKNKIPQDVIDTQIKNLIPDYFSEKKSHTISREIDGLKEKVMFDNEGKLHCIQGPALFREIMVENTKYEIYVWAKNGIVYRNDGPSIVYPNLLNIYTNREGCITSIEKFASNDLLKKVVKKSETNYCEKLSSILINVQILKLD